MKFLNRLRSKQGVALENAIVFMLVIFLLCALLSNLTLIGYYQIKIDKNDLLGKVEIEQIGEDYLAYLSLGAGGEFSDYIAALPNRDNTDKYLYETEDNTLTVRSAAHGEQVVLYVVAELTEDGCVNVKQWRYSIPITNQGE